MTVSLPPDSFSELVARVEEVAAQHARRYPGDLGGRQPVHTVYVPADRFRARTAGDHGVQARRLLDAHAPDGATLAAAIGLPQLGGQSTDLPTTLRERVAAKLAREPVEDLRIDFEDGYGVRDDATEDRDAARAAGQVAAALAAGVLPPFFGLRVKSFADGRHRRSIRTLDLFLTELVDRMEGRLPRGFVITFPKVVSAEHVAVFVELLGRLERALGLSRGELRFEVQVETTQSVVDLSGAVTLRRIAEAADGRLTGAHFGVYDYTAACGLPPDQQRLDHPACDFARHLMQVALAGTGVRLADGSTNVVPAADETAAVHHAWRVHAEHVRHSLRHGFRQGWDLHPAQLVSRFATVYAVHLADLEAVAARVRAWAERRAGREPRSATSQEPHSAAQPGGVLDEPATVRALLDQLRRAVDCGAVPEREVLARTGLTQLGPTV